MKFSMRGVALAALLACGATGAMAALSVSSAIGPGPVLFSDNSAEILIDRNNNGTLDVGDSLRGILSIDNITAGGPQTAIGNGTAYNELTGIFQTIVLAKIQTFVGVGPIPSRFTYLFGADPLSGLGAGIVGALYDDPAQNFARSNCSVNTAAACEATATGGALWATLSTAGGFWSATNAVDNTSLGGVFPLNTPLGQFGMGLNFVINNTGFQWNKVNCFNTATFAFSLVDVCGNGSIIATGRNTGPGATVTPYDLFDDVNFTANRVPEPGSMSLFALALLGLGASMRKRKAK